MVTFANKTQDSILLTINEKERLTLSGNSDYRYEAQEDALTFTVASADIDKMKPAGYIFLAFLGLIGMLLDFGDSDILHFSNRLSLPVRAVIEPKDKNTIVELTNLSRPKSLFCSVNTDAALQLEPIVEAAEIDRQYTQFQKESLATLFVPLLLVSALLIVIFLSKNIISYFVAAAIIAIVFAVWYFNHKNNKRYIESLKAQALQSKD